LNAGNRRHWLNIGSTKDSDKKHKGGREIEHMHECLCWGEREKETEREKERGRESERRERKRERKKKKKKESASELLHCN
jgi:hypothetical protein